MFNEQTYYYYINMLKKITYISYIIIPIINLLTNSIKITLTNNYLTIITILLKSIVECYILTITIGIITENMKMKLEIYHKIVKEKKPNL